MPLPPAAVRRTVRVVLDGERAGAATVSVTFLSSQRMRAQNRRTFGRDRATDVIAFGMRHDGHLVADLYVSPAAAAAAAARFGVPPREEIVRLVIHGTLHALGQDHPDGASRVRSPMWQRQERYVQRAVRLRSR
ncbi:MAG: rRNA maturation RNase YbeY [Gemmatimonadota bacterium]|nr:rRNA maturation RNase YbeY [Gemmatimonadota bacterium]MDH4349656.1 rRNA maturation RNase YbeY [Gemmatimonadota bacterium]MDH5195858.1 rRNA maturation RNase YbeY [Gemmatimonadota bacterium]